MARLIITERADGTLDAVLTDIPDWDQRFELDTLSVDYGRDPQGRGHFGLGKGFETDELGRPTAAAFAEREAWADPKRRPRR